MIRIYQVMALAVVVGFYFSVRDGVGLTRVLTGAHFKSKGGMLHAK